jgi:hypothetical protein
MNTGHVALSHATKTVTNTATMSGVEQQKLTVVLTVPIEQ